MARSKYSNRFATDLLVQTFVYFSAMQQSAIAPHLYLPQLVDEASRREQALALCLELLGTCDEVRVFGDLVTEGMERELREAKRLGLPAHFVREVRA